MLCTMHGPVPAIFSLKWSVRRGITGRYQLDFSALWMSVMVCTVIHSAELSYRMDMVAVLPAASSSRTRTLCMVFLLGLGLLDLLPTVLP